MSQLNIEIKARCTDLDKIRTLLKTKKAQFKGVDKQIDTYFQCQHGRMKFREGTLEYALIHYERENQADPKPSAVTLYYPDQNSSLKELLSKALEPLVLVKKTREIYFINNVKFHLDDVDSLGTFVEIEAMDQQGTYSEEELLSQCNEYIQLFNIDKKDLIHQSYSDMLLNDTWIV